MGKYLKEFELTSQYEEYINSTMSLLPNVSLTNDDNMVHYNPILYEKQYLTFEALEDGTFSFTKNGIDNDIQYSKDNGTTWTALASGENVNVITGDKVMWKSNIMPSSSGIGTFSSSNNFNVCGNIMSLLYGDNFNGQTSLNRIKNTFSSLFTGCTEMIDASNFILPATTLTDNCYGAMFKGCTGLTTPPELPATIMAESCYQYMFYGCSGLTTSPKLPATYMMRRCYQDMFQGCTSLTTAPELPATTMGEQCYAAMFQGCTSLTTAPELPATTLAYICYGSMFKGCTGLTTAPSILPATKLYELCYTNMFSGCSSLTTAPELRATTLAIDCCTRMFSGCTSLTTAPELPVTTLANKCYYGMFSGCSNLTTAPELPATILAESCYQDMFSGCKNLNHITMLATNILANKCLYSWAYGVASTGTFVKHKDMTSLSNNYNGIPNGWEVKDNITLTECTSLTITTNDVAGNDTTATIRYMAICNAIDYKGNTVTGFVEEGIGVSSEFPQNTSETETVERTITFEFMGATASTVITQGVWVDYSKQHLTFEAIENSEFKLTMNACQYSLNNGSTWVSLSKDTNTPTVPAGSKIMFRCTNPSISTNWGIGTFSSTGKFNVLGNVMSMLYGNDFVNKTDLTGKNFAFNKLFEGRSNVVEAHNLILPATTLANYCYREMFRSSTTLRTSPELPATTLEKYCYYYMFCGCTSLTTAPALPATTLPDYCYDTMFYGCSKLNNITMLATTITGSNCLDEWVNGVASTGTFIKHKDMTSLPTGVSGIPSGWVVKNHITPTECTSLTITADDVKGNTTTTTIHYTATCNGVDYKGDNVTGIIEEGTAVSSKFPQNTSETETVERTITFEFMGATASTTITQGVWIPSSYIIDLNNQWELSTIISNPDSTLYDGVYQSFSNKGVNDSAALMYIDITGYTSFKFYVRSYAESNYDYVVVSNLDSTLTSGTISGTAVKMTTKGNQNSGTSISDYTLVEFTGIDMGAHRITVMFRKDSSQNADDDRGYVLIPKIQ